MTGSGGTDGPARTRVLAFNNAPDGQIQATIAGENLSIPLQAGLSPTAVLARVIEAINTHPRLAAWQITALAVSEPVTAPAEMDIIGESEDAARFRVPATGPSQFILMTPWDAPRLSSSIQNGVLLLSCPRWPIVSSCSKEPLMGQPSTGTS